MSIFHSFAKHAKEYFKSFIDINALQNIKDKQQLGDLIAKLLNVTVEIKDGQLVGSLTGFLGNVIIPCLQRAVEKHQSAEAKSVLDYLEAEQNKLKSLNKQDSLPDVQLLFTWLLNNNMQPIIVDTLWEAYLEQDKDFFDKLVQINQSVVSMMSSQAKSMEWQRLGMVLMNFVMSVLGIEYIPDSGEPYRDMRQKITGSLM